MNQGSVIVKKGEINDRIKIISVKDQYGNAMNYEMGTWSFITNLEAGAPSFSLDNNTIKIDATDAGVVAGQTYLVRAELVLEGEKTHVMFEIVVVP